MNTMNFGNEYRTKETKGKIPAFSLVKVKKVITFNDNGVGLCVDENGNEETYTGYELIHFGHIKLTNGVFDIVNDYYGSKDEFGNKNVLCGRVHLTENVRSSTKVFKFGEDCLYTNTSTNGYNYKYRDLSDQEVIDIILNEIIYGINPDLQSISCVGTNKKGLDNDPNYRDGNYYLPNNKDYTVTWCYGTIKIREGKDNGWYSGTKDVGREIYNGEMDWERYRSAKIRISAEQKLRNLKEIRENYPEIIDIIVNKIKSDDKFKLSYEFNEE